MLGELAILQKGFEPGSDAYTDKGKLFIRVGSITKQGFSERDQKHISSTLYGELKNNFQPRVGEVLLTKDGTPGIAYVIKEKFEGIISSGVMRLKLKGEDIDPEYLALCINSPIGQEQVKRDAGGAIILHWRPKQIEEFLVPILPRGIQRKIGDFVRQSYEARKRAKELLADAKRKVEEMIEKGS